MTTPRGAVPDGYYPQEAYYAPGWQAPVQPPAPPDPRHRARVRTLLRGLLALVVVAVLVGAGLGIRFWADSRPLGDVRGTVSASVRQLRPGHCVAELPQDGPVSRVDVVPCDVPHAAEVLGLHEVGADAWPGQDRVDREAQAACEMDAVQTAAGFRPVTWAPTRTGWGQGDRTAVCLAWHDGGQVVGSWTAGDEVTT